MNYKLYQLSNNESAFYIVRKSDIFTMCIKQSFRLTSRELLALIHGCSDYDFAYHSMTVERIRIDNVKLILEFNDLADISKLIEQIPELLI